MSERLSSQLNSFNAITAPKPTTTQPHSPNLTPFQLPKIPHNSPLQKNPSRKHPRLPPAEPPSLLRSSILQIAQKLNQIIKKGKPQDAIKAAKVLLSAPVLTRLEG